MRPVALLALAPLLGACGTSSEPTNHAPPAAGAREDALSLPTVPGLAVHEWGLVDVLASRGTRGPVAVGGVPGRGVAPERLLEGVDFPTGVVAPPRAAEVGEPRAPLLYFHLPEGSEPVDLEVSVTMHQGAIDEHWPLTDSLTAGDSSLRWHARVRPEPCTGSRYPSHGEAPCDVTLRAYCESSELRAFEASDASCVTVGGEDWNHLFYRGSVRGAFPLQVVRESDDEVVVHHVGGDALPGRLVLVSRDDDPNATRVRVLAPPAPGETTRATLGDAPADAGRDAIYGALARDLGLTGPEVTAFRRAWDRALFGGPREATEDVRPSGWIPPRLALLYWLPAETVDALIPLAIEPRPSTLRRALLVRVDLDASPRSYLGDSPE